MYKILNIKFNSNNLLKIASGRLNLSSYLIISNLINCLIILNSTSIEDQLISWYVMYMVDINVNLNINTKKVFKEVLSLSLILNCLYGKSYNFKTPKWAWLLCAKAMCNRFNIYNNMESRYRCCETRKLLSINVLLDKRNWITGLRIAQSEFRLNNKAVNWDNKYKCIKFNPILFWNIESILFCILSSNIIFNSLYDVGFKSIGCQPCTRAVKCQEMSRSGRWWWEDVTKIRPECGLHVGII